MNYRLLTADWLLTCDDNFNIIKNGAIVFESDTKNQHYNKIIEVGTQEEILQRFDYLTDEYCGENSVLMPGLINAHVHLEFSANKTKLKYGDFMRWLGSVIQNREELIENATEQIIDKELQDMLKSGTTTIGAISSYGFDMNSVVKTPINTVYFTEVIGSQPQMIDTLFADFKAKLNMAKKNASQNFIPAIAIHSPYSVHPVLIREVLNVAKENGMKVSAHFQESEHENDWLNYSRGGFTDFFKNFLKQDNALTKPDEFLSQFKGIENLSFTHCVEANQSELEQIKDLNASIIHCPVSNRLLNNSKLKLKYLDGINLALGTDGLSSNNSLNMFDEMENALFIHTKYPLNELSKRLISSATNGGAMALGLEKGILSASKDADIICLTLPDSCEDEHDLATMIILHTKQVDKTFIQGNEIELF